MTMIDSMMTLAQRSSDYRRFAEEFIAFSADFTGKTGKVTKKALRIDKDRSAAYPKGEWEREEAGNSGSLRP